MTAFVTLLGIALVPVTATWAILRGLRLLSARGGTAPARWGRGGSTSGGTARSGTTGPCGPPVGDSLGQLVDELGRLERAYRELEALLVPTADPRMRALTHRYDATLRRCCAALGLPLPGPPPLDGLARLEVEATLAQHGLSW